MGKSSPFSSMTEKCLMGYKSVDELTGFCSLGLERARWYKDHPNSSAAEELRASGCPFGVLSEDQDCYCFFKMITNKADRCFSDDEIARRLGISVAQVRDIGNRAILKIRGTEYFRIMKDLRESGDLYIDSWSEEDMNIYYPDAVGTGPESYSSDEPADTDSEKSGRGRRVKVVPMVPSPDQ